MPAYVDSSVLLRVLLGQEGQLNDRKKVETAVASALVELECLRTLDRLRLVAQVSESEIAVRREAEEAATTGRRMSARRREGSFQARHGRRHAASTRSRSRPRARVQLPEFQLATIGDAPLPGDVARNPELPTVALLAVLT
jgi:hypothetical protein